MAKQNPDFPMPNMPRMGRRNAIVYPNVQSVVSSDGAFSPINLVGRASTEDYQNLDPEGILKKGFLRNKGQKFDSGNLGNSNPLAPAPSLNVSSNETWKKMSELASPQNKLITGIGILSSNESRINGKLAVLATKQRARAEAKLTESDIFGANRVTPVIPWRKPNAKTPTLAEERRKLFESFNMTSFEPPNTPKTSSLAMKGPKPKKHSLYSYFNSKESLASSKRGRIHNTPYANVLPKVNTGIRANEVPVDKIQRNVSTPITAAGKSVLKNTVDSSKGSSKSVPGSSNKKATFTKYTSASASLKPGDSFKPPQQRLVTNYSALESVKDTVNKLPLTIGPRFNPKRELGLNEKTRKEIASMTQRLYGGPTKSKYPTTGSMLQDTIANLQKINNIASGINSTGIKKGGDRANVTGKSVPTITTIQAPPSPFIMSSISIPNQLHTIPINGEVIKGQFASGVGSTLTRKEAPNAKVKTAKGLKSLISKEKDKTSPMGKKGHTVQLPPENIKIVPSLGTSANKYNNIYIGPYSGSDSEDGGSKRKQ